MTTKRGFGSPRVHSALPTTRRRPPRGPLAGTLDLPATGFATVPPRRATALAAAPFAARWRRLPGEVRHAMSRFEARVVVFAARDVPAEMAEGVWLRPEALDGEAIAGLARKLLAHGGLARRGTRRKVPPSREGQW